MEMNLHLLNFVKINFLSNFKTLKTYTLII